jgi:acetate kinase
MDAIAVINAGSSSLKFSLFAASGGDLDLVARGQAEGFYTAPRFVAKRADGQLLSSALGARVRSSHDGALDHLVPFLREGSPTTV